LSVDCEPYAGTIHARTQRDLKIAPVTRPNLMPNLFMVAVEKKLPIPYTRKSTAIL